MTRKRTILAIAGAFIFGALCGGGGTMLVAANRAADTRENAIAFLEGLNLGELVDGCKPAKAQSVVERRHPLQPEPRKAETSVREMALPARSVQVRWVGKIQRELLLDKLITRLRLHFQQKGYVLRLAQSTDQTTPGKSTLDHRLYRCETSDGTCAGMIGVTITTRDDKDCTVSILCSSAGPFVRKDSDRPV
jgi:hypothetical protein